MNIIYYFTTFVKCKSAVLDLLHAHRVSLSGFALSVQSVRYPDSFHSVRPQIRCLGLLAVHSANIRFCFAFSKQVSSLALFTGTCFVHFVHCTLAKIRCHAELVSASFLFGIPKQVRNDNWFLVVIAL